MKDKIIGGPAGGLSEESALFNWSGFSIRAWTLAFADARPEARFLIPGVPLNYDVADRLKRAGADRMSNSPTWRDSTQFTFRWVEHHGHYIPPHWRRIGVERAIALYRIFGADESKWPEVT